MIDDGTQNRGHDLDPPQNASWLGRTWYRLLRYGFHLFYNEMAWTYDAVSWLVSLGYWKEWQRAAVPYLKGERVLEIAHGPGHMLVDLSRRGFDVYGIDLSPFMGRQAQKNLSKAHQMASLARADVRGLPFKSEFFDSVLSTFPAEFIVDPRTIRELSRILIPGGQIVVVPEAHLKDRGLIRRFIGWLFVITGQRAKLENDGWLAQIWDEMERRVEETGLVLSVENVDLDESEVTVVILAKSEALS
jgi:ubiquinone/menaquinone biosynthesis C-methylase UbiE